MPPKRSFSFARSLRASALPIVATILALATLAGGAQRLLADRAAQKPAPVNVAPVLGQALECAPGNGSGCAHPARALVPGAAPAVVDLGGKSPRLLEFSSKACPACERMASVVRAVEKACAAPVGTIVPVSVDDDMGEAIASRYEVTMLPTFMSVDSDGQEVERLVGVQPGARLAEAIAAVRGEACAPL